MRRIAGLMLLILSAGCAAITPRNGPPTATAFAASSIDAAASCIVDALNKAQHSDTPALVPSVTSYVQVILPGRVYEVMPQQTIVMTGEAYFVRLTAETPTRTRIEAFGIGVFGPIVSRAAATCSGAK